MMTKTAQLLFVSTALASLPCLLAQTNTFPSTGNVGIGTTSPGSKLEVRDANGGFVQVNPNDGAIELGSGNDAFSFIDFRGSNNLTSDYRGRFGFWDGSNFLLYNNSGSDVVLDLANGRTNCYFTLRGGVAGDAAAEFAFERTAANSGNIYIGGNASGNIVFRSGGYAHRMLVNSQGLVGIGTSSPLRRVHLFESNGYCEQLWEAGSFAPGTVGRIWRWGTAPNGSFNLQALNSDLTASAHAITTTANGNVGIGTMNPTRKLEVAGTVRAMEVIVETTSWPDFVFTKEHVRLGLDATESFINEHGHLPGVPSASEVNEKGISIGHMQAVLLQKIEELTLNQIELNKEVRTLRKENADLRRGFRL